MRTYNKERRHLYDYDKLAVFENLHIDVKHILDKHALPIDAYKNLDKKEIPKYQWNIIDAKTRFRFIAYSYNIYAEFGFRFILTTIQFIRSITNNYDLQIKIGMDNGMEFCAGSERKQTKLNALLEVMNAVSYSYNPYFDVRKNLIERSHLSDDEELYIPRGEYISNKKVFLEEAKNYQYYWNFQRSHSGIGMHGKTPFEVIQKSNLSSIHKLLKFPTIVLDENIDALRETTRIIEFESFAKQNPDKIIKSKSCPKTKRNIESNLFLPTYAQNVLTYYLENCLLLSSKLCKINIYMNNTRQIDTQIINNLLIDIVLLRNIQVV